MPTPIAWTDETWNPTRGCSRVNADCGVDGGGLCYAIRMARRQDKPGKAYEGLTKIRRIAESRDDLGYVLKRKSVIDWSGVVRLAPEMLDAPLRWRAPKRVFVNSMSDLFHPALADENIDEVFGVMWACLYLGRRDPVPGHVFQILTKRAARMLDYCSQDRREQIARIAAQHCEDSDGVFDQTYYRMKDGPHPRIWLGVSAGHQAALDEFVPLLLRTPAALRWVSIEPQTEEVDLAPYLSRFDAVMDALRHPDVDLPAYQDTMRRSLERLGVLPEQALREAPASATLSASPLSARLDWVVSGGESGPGARPFDLAWARKTRDQCRAASVPWFCKQLGSRPVERWCGDCGGTEPGHADRERRVVLKDRGGKTMAEWPEDLRVQEFPVRLTEPE